MAYMRLFRRVRLAPGVSLNLTKRGPSLSLGVRGAHVTIGRNGVRKTVGMPGTGVYYTSQQGWHSGVHSGQHFHDAAPALTGWQRALNVFAVAVLAAVLLIIGLGILGAFIQ